MHCELNPRSTLNSFQATEISFPKSLNFTSILVVCKVHRYSSVKSLDPYSLMFQTPSKPIVLKMKTNSTSIPVA
jgi:hypothetical protein